MDIVKKISQGRLSYFVGQSALVLGLRLSGGAIQYATQVFLARWMGATEMGSYVLAISWFATLAAFSGLGYSAAAPRYIPQYIASDRWAAVKGFVRRGGQLVTLSSVGVSLLALGAILAVDAVDPIAARTPLLVGCLGVPVFALATLAEDISRARSWMVLAYLPSFLVRQCAFLAILGALVAMGVQLDATTAVAIMVATSLAVVAWQGYTAYARLEREAPPTQPEYHTRTWLRTALPLIVVIFVLSSFAQMNVALAGLFMPAADLAIYNAAYRTAEMIGLGAFAVGIAFAPHVSRLFATDERRELQRLAAQQTQLMFWPTLAGVAVLWLIGEHILALFGGEFVRGYTVLLILAASKVVIGAIGAASQLLILSGNQDRCVVVLLVALVATVVLNGILVPIFGMIGAAVSVFAVTVLWTTWFYFLARHRLGLRVSVLAIRDALGQRG